MRQSVVAFTLLALAVVLVFRAVIFFASTLVGSPICLVPVGEPGHEESGRNVCSTYLSIERTTGAWSRESWIAVPKGTSLHSEIRSAKQLQFELDPGSGLADACVAEE